MMEGSIKLDVWMLEDEIPTEDQFGNQGGN